MSIAKYVQKFLLTSPFITVSPFDMQIDFVGETPTQYSIEAEPVHPVVKRYLTGDTIRQFVFSLVQRADIITDDVRSSNNDNYEKLSLWLEQQTKSRALPPMEDEARAMKIEAIGAQYVLERAEDNSSALYMMQCALTYYQKARTIQ